MYSYSQDFFRAKRKVVIYARVSTEHEAQLSALENQIDWYKPILDAHPEWELVGTYIDEGITGTSAEKREQFMKMIADAKEHKFDLIITREVSRFARNTVDTLQYTRELRRIGVEVFFLNDNIKTFDGDGELRLTIMATLAQDESRKTSIRVKSGQQTSMEKGVVYGNGNILGYKRVGKEMVIDPEQAKTVRLIYDLYLAGYGLSKIKYELESRGIKTSTGKSRWACTVISGVLKNTFYHGVITYHKEYVPDDLTQKKIKNRGELELIHVNGTHTPIVTKEEYDKVQNIMSKKRKVITDKRNCKKSQGKRPHKSIWGKLLICSCGQKFNRMHYSYTGGTQNYAYSCYRKRNDGSKKKRQQYGIPLDNVCLSPTISEMKLDMVASYIFQYFVSNKEEIINIATSILKDHILDEEEAVNNTDYITSLNEEIAKLNKKFDALIELRTDGAISKDIFMTKAAEIEKRQKELKAKLQELEPKEKTSDAIDYEQKIQLFAQVLNEYTKVDFDKKIPPSVLEAFIKAVVVYPDSLEFHMRIGDTEEYNNIGTSVKILEFMVDRTFALKFIAGRKDVHHIKLTRWHDMKCSIHI